MKSPPPPQADWAYFLDLDGTLLEFSDHPAATRSDEGLQALIAGLYRATGGALAVISGRAIADVDSLIGNGALRLPVAGQHGTERRDAAGRVTHHDFPAERLEWARSRLIETFGDRPGVLVEHKGLSLAVHYRRAPRLAGYAHRVVRSLAPRLGAQFCIQPGKRIVEVKPAGNDKGVAVVEFMREEPFRGRTAVFIGDDLTDEYGFATVNQMGGHSIKVGPGRTSARWRLPDVVAVRAWLNAGARAA